jgi:prepilin-type N-terminal cleavage/methylation domain-containing protein
MRVSSREHRESGFTLVELMVAIFVLLVGVLGSVALVDGANRSSSSTRAREGATNLARDVVETMRNFGIKQTVATNADLATMLKNGGVGGTVSGTNLTVNRRNFTYTVQASACAVDDPADGEVPAAQHDTTFNWCDTYSGTSDANNNPLDYAKANVLVTWRDRGGTHQVRQASVINNQSDGPAVATLNLETPSGLGSSPVINGPGTTQLIFDATTDQAAQTAEWYLNGADQGSITKTSGTDWRWTWDLKAATGPSPCTPSGGGVLDGTYLVGIQAFDASGLSAGTKALTVTLNRCAPMAPTGFAAVRTLLFNDVELSWDTNPEPDVIGYRIFRNGSPISTGPCAGIIKTAQCFEPDPGGSPTYYVTAVDKDSAGANRDSQPSAGSAPATTNTAPKAPTNVVANGPTSTLKFTTPSSPQDPDSGDKIDHFNIYRIDGSTSPPQQPTPADRYDSVSNSGISAGTTVTWNDDAVSGIHTYWVTAVDTRGGESTVSGPVVQ